MSIEFSMTPVGAATASFHEGQDVTFRFTVSYEANGSPLRGANLAAWMDLIPKDLPPNPKYCSNRVASLLSGSVYSRAELDLNAYYVLVMNDDATITVVDPLFGFGNSKLLALIPLAGPGKDWVLSPDGRRLYVSIPSSDKLAVINTSTWTVEREIQVGPQPGRLGMQRDGRYVWASLTDGVVAVECSSGRVVARIPTGAGEHDIAISDDSRTVFSSSRQSGTVSVIDTRLLRKIGDLATAPNPVSLAFSSLSQRAYVVHDGGEISVISDKGELVRTVRAEVGLSQIRFAPGGRWGFITDPEKDEVSILDAAVNRIIQTGKVEKGPDQVTFSDRVAYIRHKGSESVLMIPLDNVGRPGAPLAPADFPGGQTVFGRISNPTPADGIVKTPGGDAVLVANPADRSVYYYEQGMAAPKGQFSNYGHEARAVLVVDRTLSERAPGVYETTGRLRQAGHYLVPFVMTSPAIVHCFEANVDPSPTKSGPRANHTVVVQSLTGSDTFKTGQTIRVRFRIVDAETEKPLDGLSDIRVLTTLAPGFNTHRQQAVMESPGVYGIDLKPDKPGTYMAFVECRSHGLTFNNMQRITLQVADATGEKTK